MSKLRGIACIMVLALLVSTGAAFADVRMAPVESKIAPDMTVSESQMDITRDKALEIAKKAMKDFYGLSVDDSKYLFTIESRKDWSDPSLYVWAMNWNYNNETEYFYANVVLDGKTGDILELGKSAGKYTDQTSKVTVLTKDEAQKKAEEFIQKIVPKEIFNQTKLVNSNDGGAMYGGPGPIYYNFNYVRLIDGIRYDMNYINIGVEGSTGEINNFNYRWNKTLPQLPSKEGIVGEEKASQLLKDATKLDLSYLPIRDEFHYTPTPKKVKLIYRPLYDFANMLDAKTGKLIGWNGKEQDAAMKTASLTEKQINDILKEAKPVVKKDKEISKERAQEVALAVIKDQIGEAVKINSVNYAEGDGYWETAGRKAWSIEFSVESKNTESSAASEKGTILPMTMNGRVMIDALTEELIAFNNWDYYPMPYGQDFKPAMTWEEAYGKAIEMVKKYHPGKIKDIRTEQAYFQYTEVINNKEIPPMEYYFNFTRLVDGVLYEENNISIGFNNRTGKLTNYTCRWDDTMKFPGKSGVMSQSAAKDSLWKYNEMELVYQQFNMTNDYQNPKFEYKLIYRMVGKNPNYGPYVMLDAQTGKAVDYNGNPLPDLLDNDFDNLVKGHAIEKEAKILAQQGIIDRNTFKPDASVTKLEAIKMLVKARGMDYYYPMKEAAEKLMFSDISEDSTDYRTIQQAMRYGLIDNTNGKFDPDAELSREELAVMLVKLLRYEKLAKATDIFTITYKDQGDIAPDKIGYVAICKGLDLVEKSDTFRPKDKGTMAELAHMIYKAMGYIQRP
ncbi:MAG: YcdB/YcdC domain-containing protein [Bacillota bacterium]